MINKTGFLNFTPNIVAGLILGAMVPAAWYATGQIRAPERSMYLVDSPAGEVIQPWKIRYKRWDQLTNELNEELHVDFRYGTACLMLFLDGHIEPQQEWETLDDLEDFDFTEEPFDDPLGIAQSWEEKYGKKDKKK